MKRLNGVLAVLTNPAERAHYDCTLARSPAPWQFPRLPAVRRALRLPKWFWTVAGAVAILGMLSYLFHQGPHPPAAWQIDQAPAATTAPAKAPARQPVPQRFRAATSTVPERLAESNPGSEPPAELLPGMGSRPAVEASHTDATSGHPVERPLPAIQPVQSAGAPAHPTLSGEWLFVPSAHSKNAGLYPPEYIELRVTEEAGIVHGRYRARYRITDRAISPTVSFQFAGPAEADAASLPWIGVGGAKGDVSLRLIDSGALEVTWVATQMGEELGLISGTATLIRRLD